MSDADIDLVKDRYNRISVKRRVRQPSPIEDNVNTQSVLLNDRNDVVNENDRACAQNSEQDDIEESKRLIIKQIEREGLVGIYIKEFDPEQHNV